MDLQPDIAKKWWDALSKQEKNNIISKDEYLKKKCFFFKHELEIYCHLHPNPMKKKIKKKL
jgi:hypothetical protein